MPCVTTTNGTHIAYETFGHRTNPSLLLIQGLSAQMIGWRPQLCRAFADAGFHVIRFDNRDVGQSQKFPGSHYSLTDMADDAAGLLHAIEVPAAHVVGQSMGGMIAQELAIRHPKLTLSLALLYTSASSEWILTEAHDRANRIEVTDRQSAITAYLANEASCASPGYEQDVSWLMQLGGQMFDRDPGEWNADRQMEAITNSRDRRELVREINAPTTIIVGDADRLIDPKASIDLHHRIPGSSLEVIPGMGHELPLAVLPLVVDTVTRNAAGTRPELL